MNSTPLNRESQVSDAEGPSLEGARFDSSSESPGRSTLPDQPEIESAEAAEAGSQQSREASHPHGEASTDDKGQGWRDELSARLNQYRARRKPLPPRYPSLRLRFEPDATSHDFTPSSEEPLPLAPAGFENISHRALALDVLSAAMPSVCRAEGLATPCLPFGDGPHTEFSSHSGAKIIEFPRTLTTEPPPRPIDELAEPVMERPRILEAPEITLPPALGGITIEAGQQEEIEKCPGIDFPLQSAPLARRVVAASIDGLILAAASGLFAFIFWKIIPIVPPRLQMLGLLAGIPSLLCAAYQYLLVVYSGSTPGLRIAGLELVRFDGSRPNRTRRRWRVLASYLSAISLGMGYAWVFLDEDALCWHDRITHTYLAPRAVNPKHN